MIDGSMRRKEREVTDWEDIVGIIRRCKVCHVAFHGEQYPYVVPLNFGVAVRGEQQLCLYFHGADVGRKHELLRQNPHVAFVMENAQGIHTAADGRACGCSMFYESVMGEGILEYVDGDEKLAALRCLMRHYTDAPSLSSHFDSEVLNKTVVLRLTAHRLSAKRHAPRFASRGLRSE